MQGASLISARQEIARDQVARTPIRTAGIAAIMQLIEFVRLAMTGFLLRL